MLSYFNLSYIVSVLFASIVFVSCSTDSNSSSKKIVIKESPDFWEEITPSLVVEPGVTTQFSSRDWRNLLSTPSFAESQVGNRVLNFHILENGTFFLEKVGRSITFFYSDDFGNSWKGVQIKDEEDPSFTPYFGEGSVQFFNDKVCVSTGVGGTIFRNKGKPRFFESTDGISWKNIGEEGMKEQRKYLDNKGLRYSEDYNFSYKSNTSKSRNIYDYQSKKIYKEAAPELEEGVHQSLVVTCDGSKLKFGGPPLATFFARVRPVFERNEAFMLRQSNFIYDNILGHNSGPIDTLIANFNEEKPISGHQKLIDKNQYHYYVRANNEWIKTNQYLRESSVKYCIADKRLYGISDDGRFFRSKLPIETSCKL